MPRNPGTGVYSIPVGTDAITNTTIASSPYNAFIHDVETDLNTPRPIVAGGTGGTDQNSALINLSGERAAQVVTNWDSMIWMPGSFYAATSATGTAPVAAHAFSGICYSSDPLPTGPSYTPVQQNIVLEARDLTDTANPVYVRIMTAGVWGTWKPQRQSIYAAPMDAMAYSGIQINGSMEVSQEKGYGTNVSPNGYVCDGWQLGSAGTVIPAAVIGSGSLISGLSYLLAITVGTAQVSLGANDYTVIQQMIEGWRISRLAWGTIDAQPITIGFWTKHHRIGVYGGSIRNFDGSRSCTFTYTQAVADVAQYNTITIPGCINGVWNIDNTIGMRVMFAMAVGTTFTAPTANVWANANYFTGPGQINGVAATSDVFRLTGVVVLPGLDAPSAARSPLIMRPFDQELMTCQRYFEATNSSSRFTASGAGLVLDVPVFWRVTKRGAPTAIISTAGTRVNASVAVINPTIYGAAHQVQASAGGDVQSLNETISADTRL